MSRLSGVKLIPAALSPLLLTAFSLPAWAVESVPQSVSVAEFSKNPKNVSELRRGIALMKAASSADPNSAKYRTSFAYWSNTHGYFGNGTHATNLQAYIAYRMPQCLQVMTQAQCNAYYAHMSNTAVPNDGFTDQVWGTCQHGNLNFLPWHRLYLHFFGRTLRKYIGNPDFTLPYWNYFDNYVPAKKGLQLPGIILGGAKNSLYDQWRTLGLNENSVVMDPSSASAVQAFKFNDFTNFSNTLQGQPHGAMHCAVGSGCTAPDIGFVPIAGLDPVFYMHHTNIDRLWQCWMVRKAHGQKIDLAWAKANLGMPDSWYDTSYSFADENGNKVTMTIADVFTPGKVDVNYDHLSKCEAMPSASGGTMLMAEEGAAPKGSPLKSHVPLSSAKAVTLGASVADVDLQTDNARAALKAEAATPDQPLQSYLTLVNVALKGSPALTYKIYLFNKKAPQKASYIATINFFGAGDHHHDGGDASSLGTLVYQVSSNLEELGVTSASDAGVRFEPTSLLMGKNTVKQKPENGVTVENILLETSTAAPAQK